MTDSASTDAQVAEAVAWFLANPAAVDYIGADDPDLHADDHARTIVKAAVAGALEVDRLRAELAETRAVLGRVCGAGDCLAEASRVLVSERRVSTPSARQNRLGKRWDRLTAALAGWRSVRGDAPGESVSWTDLDRATATIRRVMPSDATTVICGADVEEVAREKLPDGAFRVTTRRRTGRSAAPADNTAVQGWGDVESADFIERARAATVVGSFTAQFDHVYDPSGDLVCESVDHSTAVRIAAALSAAPADATAAPDPVVGYVLARVGDGTVTLWDDDVRTLRREVQIAHVEHVDDPGAGWRCYELRDVCEPVRDSQDGGA